MYTKAGDFQFAVGGSTGTNVWGALTLATEMRDRGIRGSLVTLICDRGDRYLTTYYDDDWLARQGIELEAYAEELDALMGDAPRHRG